MGKVECPKCGHAFYVRGRAETGKGTCRGKSLKRLTRNHIQLIGILKKAGKPITAHEVQGLLFTGKNGSPLHYKGRKGEKYWNYHDCQAQLSVLVGANLVSMTEPHTESFDWDNAEFVTKPAPRYFLTVTQGNRVDKIIRKGIERQRKNPSEGMGDFILGD